MVAKTRLGVICRRRGPTLQPFSSGCPKITYMSIDDDNELPVIRLVNSGGSLLTCGNVAALFLHERKYYIERMASMTTASLLRTSAFNTMVVYDEELLPQPEREAV